MDDLLAYRIGYMVGYFGLWAVCLLALVVFTYKIIQAMRGKK